MQSIMLFVALLLVVAVTLTAAATTRPQVDVTNLKIHPLTGRMVIPFLAPTNQGGIFGPRPCSDFLIAPVVDFSRHVCRFVNPQEMFIDAPSTSNWTSAVQFFFKVPSPIANATSSVDTLTASGPYQFSYVAVTAPTASIFGPSKMDLCASGTYFQIVADFSAGRPFKSASFSSVLPLAFNGGNPAINLASLDFFIDKSRLNSFPLGPPGPRTWTFQVTLINAFGFTVTTSAFSIGVEIAQPLTIPVIIRGAGSVRTYQSSQEIRLSALAQVEPTCFVTQPPPGWGPDFTWEVRAVTGLGSTFDSGVPVLNGPSGPLISRRPELIIPPFVLLPKENVDFSFFAVRLRLNTTASGLLNLDGLAEIKIQIAHSNPVIVLEAPNYILNGTALHVDATRSCDPDYYVPLGGCLPNIGRVNMSLPGFLRFTTAIERWDGTSFSILDSTEYEFDGGDGDDGTDGFWIRPGLRPGYYSLQVVVERLKHSSGSTFTVRKLFTVGLKSAGESETCKTPFLGLPSYPLSSVSALGNADSPPVAVPRDVPFVLRSAGAPPGTSLSWTVFTSPQVPQAVAATFTPFTDRPALSISDRALFPGYQYTFRLVGAAPCGGGVATATVSFTVNVPPRGGVVQVSPSTGVGFSTPFFLRTGGWGVDDPALQLPLSFEFQYTRIGTRAPVTLSSASGAFYVITRLASPRQTCRLPSDLTKNLITVGSIRVICRDALGSSSIATTNNISVTPYFQSTTPLSDLATSALPLTVLNDAKKTGQNAEDQLRILAVLAEEAASSDCIARNRSASDRLAFALYRKQVASQLLNLLQITRDVFRQSGRPPSTTQYNLLVAAFSSAMSGAFSSFGEGELTLASQFMQLLINDAQDLNTFGGSLTPETQDFAPIFLDTLSGIARSLRFVREESEGRDPLGDRDEQEPRRLRGREVSARGLETRSLAPTRAPIACRWQCDVASDLQNTLRRLSNVLLNNFEPGSEPRIVRGSDIELKLSRELRNQVGKSDGVNKLDLQDGPRFALPPDLLNDPRRIRNGQNLQLPDTIDIAAVRYRFNPLELAREAELPPGVDLSRGTRDIKVQGVVATNFSIEEVSTILFLDQGNALINLDPFNLTERINITIPLPETYVPPTDNTTQEIACGFWDESFSGWSAEGCVVLSVDLVGRTVTCSCNHASDFAAWNAFIANLGGGDIGVVATISIVVSAILLPAILLAWFAAFLWARNKDEEDSNAVHLGALVLLTKNRLKLHQQQRRFFQLLRENAKRPAGAPSVTKRAGDAEQGDNEVEVKQSFVARSEKMCFGCFHQASVLGSWARALYYDHSFFGIFTRFDPFYTRTQRVTVFTMVLVGNLFAASFFFEFKTTNDLSAGVLIASVIIAALVVAVPVKITVRWLFRATEFHLGSPMHRVAQIYRISEFQAGDIIPAYASEAEKADSEMLYVFKDYYAAKSNVLACRSLLRDIQMRESGSVSWWQRLSGACCKNKGSSAVERRKLSLTARLGLKVVDEDSGPSREELEKAAIQGEAKVEDLALRLRDACKRSAEEWEKVPRRANLRVETMRKQQSTLLKFASLLYDEVDTRARIRTKYLSTNFIYVAWFVVFVYLLGGLAYCARWVLGRTSYRGVVDPNSTQDELESDANGVIVAWLLSATVGVAVGVFLSEPVIQFIRFSIMPWVLRRFGNGTTSLFSKRNKVKPQPELSDDDNLGKIVVGRPVLTVGHAKDDPVSDNFAQSNPALLQKQPSDGAVKRGSLMNDFEKRVRQKKNEEAGNPFFETLADVIEALA